MPRAKLYAWSKDRLDEANETVMRERAAHIRERERLLHRVERQRRIARERDETIKALERQLDETNKTVAHLSGLVRTRDEEIELLQDAIKRSGAE